MFIAYRDVSGGRGHRAAPIPALLYHAPGIAGRYSTTSERATLSADYKISAFADEIDDHPAVQFQVLSKLGVQEIQLRGGWGQNVMELSMPQLKDLRSMATDHGLEFHAIGSPLGKVDIESPEWESLNGVRTAASAAHAVGCDRVRVFSFYRGEGVGPEETRDRVVDRLGAMCDLAESAGVQLVHENERDIYGDTADRCRDLLDELPLLGCCFDFANFVQVGEDTLRAWSTLKDRVKYFDVKDAVAASGEVVPAGQGDGNLLSIFGDALSADFDDRFNLEPHLKTAGQFGGTTGPELFEVAVDALMATLKAARGR